MVLVAQNASFCVSKCSQIQAKLLLTGAYISDNLCPLKATFPRNKLPPKTTFAEGLATTTARLDGSPEKLTHQRLTSRVKHLRFKGGNVKRVALILVAIHGNSCAGRSRATAISHAQVNEVRGKRIRREGRLMSGLFQSGDCSNRLAILLLIQI